MDEMIEERRHNKSEGSYLSNRVHICIDEVTRENELRGRVHHDAIEQVQPFLGVDQLLLRIEEFLDAQNYPASSTESRRFGKNKSNEKSTDELEQGEPMYNKDKGDKATFVIQVQYRQNATWQGHVTWVEKDIERPFRSALELIKLLDNSVETTDSK